MATELSGVLIKIDIADGNKEVKEQRYAPGADTSGGVSFNRHGEGLVVIGDYIFALWDIAGPGAGYNEYRNSELVKMDLDLNVIETVTLDKNSGASFGSNFAYHDGKLYIGFFGGRQFGGNEGGNSMPSTSRLWRRRRSST